MTEQRFTPIALVRYLDRYIIGHDEAKRTMAVAIYAHLRKVERSRRDGRRIIKSNVLMVGPTGSGKTFLCETLARALRVPFVTAEATSLSQSRHVVDEIEAIMQRLVDGAGGDLERAQLGVVFIDEIDKLRSLAGSTRTSGESVQHALLKSSLSAESSKRCGLTSLLPLKAHAVAYVLEYRHRHLSAERA